VEDRWVVEGEVEPRLVEGEEAPVEEEPGPIADAEGGEVFAVDLLGGDDGLIGWNGG
jgi:hypothetical protein